MPSIEDFRAELHAQIARAHRQQRPHAEINAGELHRAVGGYPSSGRKHHAMSECCRAMREELELRDAVIVFETASGQSPSFTVRYSVPR